MKIRKSDVPAKPAPAKKKSTPDPGKRLLDAIDRRLNASDKRTGEEMNAIKKVLVEVASKNETAVKKAVDSTLLHAPAAPPARYRFEISRDYRGFIESVEAIPVNDVN